MKTISLFLIVFSISMFCGCDRPQETSTVTIQLPVVDPGTQSYSSLSSSKWSGSVLSSSEINCYGVLVTGPEAVLNTNKCFDRSQVTALQYGPHRLGVSGGMDIQLDVPSGKQRTVYLVGMNALSGYCQNFSKIGLTPGRVT